MKLNGYDGIRKALMRDMVIGHINRHASCEDHIFGLETSDWSWHKQMPYQRKIIYQLSDSEYESMLLTKPNKVRLYKGNINQAIINYPYKIKGAWLDYCKTFTSNKDDITTIGKLRKFEKLAPVIFTFSTRHPRKQNQISNATYIIKKYFNIIRVEAYKDGGPMVMFITLAK